MSTPPTIRCTVTARVGTDRAALVVRLPDGAGPAWAPGTQVLLTLVLPDVDQSGSASRVDPSTLVGGGDPSGTVVDVSDDAIEAARSDLALACLSGPSGVRAARFAEFERLIAARVRAEAVADERRRVASEVEGEFRRRIQARVDQNRADGYPQTADAMVAGAGYLLEVLREWAAGSVPVATPEPCSPLRNRVDWLRDQHARYHDQPGNMLGRDECGWEPCRFWDGAEWVLGARSSGPVATPTEPERCPACFAAVPGPLPLGWVCGNDFHGPYRAASPVPAEQPTEVASITLDALGDWSELAEAFGAVLVNHEVGDSGEYETGMHWPNGRSAWRNDQLVILTEANLPADLPAAEQPEER